MARTHTKDTVITINSVNLSAFINDSELSVSVDSHDTTGYGVDSKTYIAGLVDATFSCEGTYDDGASTPQTTLPPLLGAAAFAVLRQPEGAGSGLPQESFNAILTDYTESNPVADIISWSAEFQVTGDIDRTAQS